MISNCVKILLIAFPIVCQAQYYNKAIEDTTGLEAYSSVEVLDSAFLLAGFSRENGIRKTLLVKSDFNGDTIWTKKYGNDLNSDHYQVLENSPVKIGDYFYLVGQFIDTSARYIPYIIKIDSAGDTLWRKDYNLGVSTWPYNAINVGGEQLLLVGVQQQVQTGPTDGFVMKVDSLGEIIWQTLYPNSSGSYSVHKADTISSTKYVIAGNTDDLGMGYIDAWICVIDSAGNTLHQKTFGYQQGESGFSEVMGVDTILLYGATEAPPTLTEREGYILMCDSMLNFRDTFFLSDQSAYPMQAFLAITKSQRSEYVVVGYTKDDSSNPIASLTCVDQQLDLKWYREYKTRENDNYPTDVESMPDGGFIMSGYVFPEAEFDSTAGTWAYVNTQDGWLVRTNCIGYDTVPRADFQAYNLGANKAEFYNTSHYAEQYHWEFGDGNTYTHWSDPADTLSTEPFVQHQYTAPGSYTVTLHAIACNDTTVHSTTINVDPNGINDPQPAPQFSLYPNPATDLVQIKGVETMEKIQVFSVSGRLLRSYNPQSTITEIAIADLESGVYFFTIQTKRGTVTLKMIKH